MPSTMKSLPGRLWASVKLDMAASCDFNAFDVGDFFRGFALNRRNQFQAPLRDGFAGAYLKEHLSSEDVFHEILLPVRRPKLELGVAGGGHLDRNVLAAGATED